MKITETGFFKALISLYGVGWVCVVIAACMAGCGTTSQTVAFKTIGGLETSVTAAYDGYLKGVVGGSIPTNSVPSVSKDFNLFQAAATLAVTVAGGSTNALAPAELILDAANVTTDIQRATSH